MTLSLKDEIVVITGATSGFGASTARLFSKHGASLILLGRREERLAALKAELETPVLTLKLDVQDRDALSHALTTLPPPYNNVTALINNAGLALGLEPAHKASLDDWEAMIDTNIKGLVTATRALLPGMVARNRGYIFNIGSTAATYPYPGGNTYGGTKAFVHQFSLNLRADLLGTNIRVTTVAPGLAESEFSTVRFHGDQEKANAVYQGTTPLTPEDIADTLLWCLTRPAHVNPNLIELMPTCQAFSPLAVHRKSSV